MVHANSVDMVSIEVVYSPQAGEVMTVRMSLPSPLTVQAALGASGLWPATGSVGQVGASTSVLGVGVWGRLVGPSHLLCDGDRLEIYRPLTADPKEARRQRYRAQGERGRAPRARRRGEGGSTVDGAPVPTAKGHSRDE